MLRIGIDIGGTFTDFVVWKNDDDGYAQIESRKIPTSRPNFAEAVKQGIDEIVAELGYSDQAPITVVHSTTVSTNAVIERSQPPVGLITTEGFRDILGLARLRLDKPVDLFNRRARPLVPRENVFAVAGRMLADGTEDRPLDEDAVRGALRTMADRGLAGCAICFVNAYRYQQHELRALEIARREFPQLEVMASHEVWPQQAEYERAVLTLLNVYVKPLMQDYLHDIDGFLRSRYPEARLYLTKSNGGIMSVQEARRLPVHTLLSGPAAGVTAAQVLAEHVGIDHVLTFDMGGTSVDVSLVESGRPTTTGQAEVGDFPLMMPVTAVEAMGAGGGSVIGLDDRVLKVGPRSVGSSPGPACYGLGSDEPALSDAYLLLGYLPGEGLLGGRLRLDRDLAVRALQPLCERLGLDSVQVAESAVAVATSEMLAKITPFLARLGVSVGDLTMMIFGGAGGIHGPLLAEEVGIRRVVVPRIPSVFCAFGGLVSDMMHDAVRSVHGQRLETDELVVGFAALAEEGRRWLAAQKVTELASVRHVYLADMRYAAQSFTIPVEVSAPQADAMSIDAAEAAFHDQHQRLFDYCDRQAPVSIDALRVRTIGPRARPAAGMLAERCGAAAPAGERDIRLNGSWRRVAVWNWDDLGTGWHCDGPAIVQQAIATILVPDGFRARVDGLGNLEMERR